MPKRGASDWAAVAKPDKQRFGPHMLYLVVGPLSAWRLTHIWRDGAARVCGLRAQLSRLRRLHRRNQRKQEPIVPPPENQLCSFVLEVVSAQMSLFQSSQSRKGAPCISPESLCLALPRRPTPRQQRGTEQSGKMWWAKRTQILSDVYRPTTADVVRNPVMLLVAESWKVNNPTARRR
jgi:hypothetical protein